MTFLSIALNMDVQFEVDQNILGHDPDSVRFYKSLSLDKGDMSYLDKAFSHM